MAKNKYHKNSGRRPTTKQKRMPAQSNSGSTGKSPVDGHAALHGEGSGTREIKPDQLTCVNAKTTTGQTTSSETESVSGKKLCWKNIIFLTFFLLWLVIYLGCESPVNRYLDYPFDQSLVKDVVSEIRTSLNFIMAFAVLVTTFWDRARIYKEISNKSRTDAGDALDSMFVPFALALVPFTSASVDLGESIASLSLALALVLFFIAGVTLADYLLLNKYKLDINTLYRFGKVHVQILIISSFLFLLFGFNVFMDWSSSSV